MAPLYPAMLAAAMILTLLFICLFVNWFICLTVGTESPWLFLRSAGINLIVLSCPNNEVHKTILVKKHKNDLAVQEPRNDRDIPCDASEVELCTEVKFIKNKNTHNRPLLLCWIRFTEILIRKI